MTREEALQILDTIPTISEQVDALEMAIQALSQQPCDDAISREAVFNAIEQEDKWLLAAKGHNGLTEIAFSGLKGRIDALLPVTQKLEWIPVSERLPEDEQEILFSTKTGRVHGGKYHDDDSANQWYSHRDKCRAWNNVVSAWMPLPEPYEPQESEGEE